MAITIHEYAHGRMAYYFGDATAKRMGRLSLNPIHHLDPIGTIALLLFGFGWAKPVPINPYNFRDYRSGMIWVSFAGPLANFILALVSLFLLYIPVKAGFISMPYIKFMETLAVFNVLLGVFNLIPVPPLDGSKILASLAPDNIASLFRQIEPYAPIILMVLIFSGAIGRIIVPLFQYMYNAMETLVLLVLGLP
ncbi:MAG: site-2 protease family protein [Firmicutes bacterium]|nr:site-2 protease family protein [Bacillota bacterium]